MSLVITEPDGWRCPVCGYFYRNLSFWEPPAECENCDAHLRLGQEPPAGGSPQAE